MSVYQNIEHIVVLAGADLSLLQFGGVKISSGKAVAATADNCDGLLWNKPDALDEPAQVVVKASRVKLRAGAAYAVDAKLTTNASGKFIAVTTGQGVKAIALEAAGGVDEISEAIWVGSYADVP